MKYKISLILQKHNQEKKENLNFFYQIDIKFAGEFKMLNFKNKLNQINKKSLNQKNLKRKKPTQTTVAVNH